MDKPPHYYAPHGKIGGWLTALFIALSAFYGSIFIYGPILPLVFLWPWLFRRLSEVLASGWQTSVVALCEKIHGTRVVVTGDAINRHEKTVVLLNHRTRLDWMFFFFVVFHSRILNRQKIALKSVLKNLPGVGWAMQVAALIFLDRTWETDQAHINNILSYFVELESKPNILFFPEVSGIHAVHDVTVAYPYNIPVGELQVLNGEYPREVHFHIKRYSIAELPENEEELAKWCRQKWAEKEEILRDFYSNPDPSRRKFKSTKSPPYHARSLVLWLSIVFWFLFCVACSWLVYFYPMARWYTCTICIFYFSVTHFFGEFVKMEMQLYDMFKKPRNLWGVKKPIHSASLGSSNNNKKRKHVYDKYFHST